MQLACMQRLDKVESKLDLGGKSRFGEGDVPYSLHGEGDLSRVLYSLHGMGDLSRVPQGLRGSQGDTKIQYEQGGIGLTHNEDDQEDYQPLLVDGTHYPWRQESTLQKSIRGGKKKQKEKTNPPAFFEQASNHHQPQQPTIRKDRSKQSSREEQDHQGPVLENLSRFLQDLNESGLLAQRRVELDVEGVASEGEEEEEEEREPVIREVSREHSRFERISRRAPREELVLSASKLNCHGSQNCYK